MRLATLRHCVEAQAQLGAVMNSRIVRTTGVVAAALAVTVAMGCSDGSSNSSEVASVTEPEPTTQTTPATTISSSSVTTAPPAASVTTTSAPTVTEPETTSPLPSSTEYTERGPYPVGVTTRVLVNRDVPDRIVYVYYPAAQESTGSSAPWAYSSLDAFDEVMRPLIPEVLVVDFTFENVYANPELADGPFPVVMFSHGAGSYPTDYSELTIRLASWGMVVVAPDHYERDRMASTPLRSVERLPDGDVDDLLAALEMIRSAGTTVDDPLFGLVAVDGPVAVVGQSAGAGAARRFALREDVSTWVGWAPSISADSSDPGVPALLIAADDDMVIDVEEVTTFAESAAAQVTLLVLSNSGHNSFTDTCPAIVEQGGLVPYADQLMVDRRLLELGEDGCLASDTPAGELWPVIAHATVAQIRHRIGFDDGSALDPGRITELFGTHVETYRRAG